MSIKTPLKCDLDNSELLEHGITHSSEDQDSPAVRISSRLEESNPEIDFKNSYRLARLFGLAPEQKTFLFKMLQNLLPTRERLHRCGKSPTASCNFCDHPEDTLDHLLSCPQSLEVSAPLLSCLASQLDNITTKDIIHLNFHTAESWDLPAVWILSTCLMFVWEKRVAGKKAKLDECRAELSARIALLSQTKWKHYSLHNSALLLNEAINLHFV